MRRLVVVLLLITIMIMSTSCATDATALMLEDKKAELLNQKEELQAKNDELKALNSELGDKVAEQTKKNNECEDEIKEYKIGIDKFKAELARKERGLGFTIDEFILNNASYAVLSDYDEFVKIESEEDLDVASPYYSYDHDKLPNVIYKLYDDDKIGSNLFLEITYLPDTHNVTKMIISYGNYEEKKEGKEKIDEIIQGIVSLYIMSASDPIIYSDKVDDMAKEFIKNKKWDDGNAIMTELDFSKFGTVYIESK